MEQVLKLAENYMMQRVMSDHSPLTHVNKAILTLSIVGGILGAISIGFILYGIYQWLSINMPSYEAYMVFGLILMALTLLTFGCIAFIQSRKRKKAMAFKNQMRDEILLNFKLAEQELKDAEIFENNPKTCLALASIAGFILSEKAF
jgi:ABC-type uncharacterized transport system permease subunit